MYIVPSPSTPKREVACPGAPKQLSRGQRLVQLSKQKALANTPVKRLSSPSLDTGESDNASKRRRFTARRNLLQFYDYSEDSVQLRSSKPSVQVCIVPIPQS